MAFVSSNNCHSNRSSLRLSQRSWVKIEKRNGFTFGTEAAVAVILTQEAAHLLYSNTKYYVASHK
jgi:hypothetical protein